MELPYLKNKANRMNQGGGGVSETREPDSYSPEKLLESVTEELFNAADRKDRKAFREALRAFVQLIADQDKEQDAPSQPR